jgi:hypothetical protein
VRCGLFAENVLPGAPRGHARQELTRGGRLVLDLLEQVVRQPQHLALRGPIPGESAWHEVSDGMLEVVDVPDDQPHAANGVWLVETEGGWERAISWNPRVGAWEVIPVPRPSPGR